MKENTFISHDGTEIFYRYNSQWNKKAIILLHRGHEHSGRMTHVIDGLWLEGYDSFAWDARGCGKTKGKRWYAPDFSYFIKDLEVFIHHISQEYDIDMQEIVIIAQSVGAVIAATWIHDYAPNIKWAILASPAFNVNLIVPGTKQILWFWQKIRGDFVVKSYVKWKHLTHDLERAESYHKDPLVALEISSNILLELYTNAHRVVSDAGAIQTPILLLSSWDDKVVFQKEQNIFFENLSSEIKEHYILDGFYHDTLGEKDREKAFEYIRNFLAKLQNYTPQNHIENSDSQGYSYEEYTRLSKELPKSSVKNIYYTLIRRMMSYLGKYLSEWIYIGEKFWYDSGSMLDYVYKNSPQGRWLWWYNLLGKYIDKLYLHSVGWKGIRKRKEHIWDALSYCITELKTAGKNIRILDIAAWHGRYILDAIETCKEDILSIVLRDYSDINVASWSKLIEERWLKDKAQFINADAFDKESIASTSPKVTLWLVSWLYELFPENKGIEESLSWIYEALEVWGYLIYTNQPWHPQVELIARTLISHMDGKPWIMRRRTQLEMDTLVKNAWFKKVEQYIDTWWIFTVCIAQKV